VLNKEYGVKSTRGLLECEKSLTVPAQHRGFRVESIFEPVCKTLWEDAHGAIKPYSQQAPAEAWELPSKKNDSWQATPIVMGSSR
jgi:hypothetical protein